MEVKPDDSDDAIRRNSFFTTAAILISRLTGLVREQVFAHFFGAGWVLDAYVAAYRIPNLMRDLVAEGALSQAFIAVYAQKRTPAEALKLADKMLTFVLLTVGGIAILGTAFAPAIVAVIARGFQGESFALTVSLTRALFPFLVFAALSAVLNGVLNVKGRFFLPQSSTTVMNVAAIIVGLAAAAALAPEYVREGFRGAPLHDHGAAGRAIYGMALGAVAGAAAACTLQAIALRRMGYKPRPDAGFRDTDLASIGKLALPASLGAAAVQLNVLINTAFASALPHGSISFLNYAFRLVQFPLGLFGAGIATAAAPSLARLYAENRDKEFADGLRSSLKLSLFFALPAALGLMVLAEPIVSLIYEHGRFGPLDTVETAYALIAYAAGLCGYALAKIYQPAFLARHDAKTPMVVAFTCVLVNLSLNAVFVGWLKSPHWALALSTSVSSSVHFLFFAISFRKKIPGVWNGELWRHLGKTALAAGLMAAVAYFILTRMDASEARQNGVIKTARVFVPIVAAMVVYFAATAALGIKEARRVVSRLYFRQSSSRR
jgi:putative peptidoglycan lipid II flippase